MYNFLAPQCIIISPWYTMFWHLAIPTAVSLPVPYHSLLLKLPHDLWSPVGSYPPHGWASGLPWPPSRSSEVSKNSTAVCDGDLGSWILADLVEDSLCWFVLRSWRCSYMKTMETGNRVWSGSEVGSEVSQLEFKSKRWDLGPWLYPLCANFPQL